MNKHQGANLLKAIKTLELTQKSFATSIKTARTSISEICSGKRPIKDYQLLLIEKVHNINPEFITGNSEEVFLKIQMEAVSENSPTELGQSPISQNRISDLQRELLGKDKTIEALEEDKRDLKGDKKHLQETIDRQREEIDGLKKENVALGKGKTSA